MTDRPKTPNTAPQAVCRQQIDLLKQSPLFCELTFDEIDQFVDFISEKTFAKDELIIEQDTLGESFFILIAGGLKVFRVGEYHEVITLGSVLPGECIGEMGFFSDGRRSASISADVDSRLIEIKYVDLEKAFDFIPKLSRNFLKIVTRRLHRSNLKFQDTVIKSRHLESTFTGFRNLIDLSHVLKFRLGIEGLIERVVMTASSVLKAERASLFLMDVIEGELWSKVAEGESHREIRIPVGTGIAGWVAQNDQMVNINNVYKDPRFNPVVDKRTGFRTHSILCGPVKNLEGEIVGVIQAINKKGGDFNKSDEELFKAFAYQTAISVENFYLYNKMSTNCRNLSLFLDISMSLSETLELTPLIEKIVSIITELLKADRTSLFLLDRDKNELWSKVAQGTGTSEIRFPADKGMAGYTATTGLTVNVQDVYQDTRFNPEYDHCTQYKTKSLLCVPLINRHGQIIGVTESINKKAGRFTGEDEELLKAISSQIAVALENAQLYEKTLEMKRYLENIHQSITNSIVTLDNHFKIITANKSALEFFELTHSLIIHQDIRDILGEQNNSLVDKLNTVYELQKTVVEDDIPICLNSAEKSININFVPLKDTKGKAKGQLLIFEDISLKKRMKNTLTRYMSKDIAEKVLNDPEKQTLGGTTNQATILFSDISEFTGISEKLSPEQTVAFLNKYYTLMFDIILINGGVLDKFIGDAIMAVFGVPYTKNDDAKQAVRTALDMVKALDGFNAEISDLGIDPISIRIGIATGRVLSGNIGSEKRMDYTVIGDSVNVSSRLETLNKLYGTTILIEENTNREVNDVFITRPIDHVVVKGSSRPIEIFEALGDKNYVVTPEDKQFIMGLACYRQRKFLKAQECFNLSRVNDGPSRTLYERCSRFLETPPPEDWDGAWVSQQK
jgi:adenylate cyclase